MAIDLDVFNAIESDLPVMNKDICGGLASKHLTESADYINEIWKTVAVDFPEGMKYEGCSMTNPYEEYAEIIRPSKPRHQFEITKSNVYMMKYKFSYNGVPIKNRFIQLLYSEDDLTKINGSLYKITPVLSGRVFNIERDKIFVPTPRARNVCFLKDIYSYLLNGCERYSDIIYSQQYQMLEASRSRYRPTLVHYMLCEHGLTKALKKYFNLDVIYGAGDMDEYCMSDEWSVFESKKLPIKGMRNVTVRNNIKIIIRTNTILKSHHGVICAIIYIIDHCAETCIDSDLDDPELWLFILPKFLFKKPEQTKLLHTTMISHLGWVKSSMDNVMKRTLLASGIDCDSVFDLFSYMLLNFDDMLIHNDIGSMNDKELNVVKHVLYDVVYMIFTLMFRLRKLNGSNVNSKIIDSTIDRCFMSNRIKVTRGHGELMPVSIASDCKMFSATCNLITHAKAAEGGKGGKRRSASNEDNTRLHQSQTEVASFLWITKTDPTGRSKLNPFAYINEMGIFTQRPGNEDSVNRFIDLITLIEK